MSRISSPSVILGASPGIHVFIVGVVCLFLSPSFSGLARESSPQLTPPTAYRRPMVRAGTPRAGTAGQGMAPHAITATGRPQVAE